MKFYNIKQAQKEALNQINTTFKLSEIGYGKGFYEGQMQERKYWEDKIKAKIEEIKDKEKKCILFISESNCKNICMENCSYAETIEVLQSLLEKE